MEALGKDIQSDMRELVSIRVEHQNGKIIRSKRGEAPRYEFGKLSKSMTAKTIVVGEKVVTTMESDDTIAGYAGFLENNLNRPHFSTVFKRLEQYAVDRIRQRAPQII